LEVSEPIHPNYCGMNDRATGLEPRFFCHNWLAVRHFAHIRFYQFLKRWVIESVACNPKKPTNRKT